MWISTLWRIRSKILIFFYYRKSFFELKIYFFQQYWIYACYVMFVTFIISFIEVWEIKQILPKQNFLVNFLIWSILNLSNFGLVCKIYIANIALKTSQLKRRTRNVVNFHEQLVCVASMRCLYQTFNWKCPNRNVALETL